MPTAPALVPELTEPLPLSTDPDNFDARADQAWEDLQAAIPAINIETQKVYDNALEVFTAATEIAAASIVAADAAGFVATSTSNLTVNAGTKVIHFDAAKPKLAVDTYQLMIKLASDNTIFMVGNVSDVTDSDDIEVNVVSGGVSGSGEYAGPWIIIASAFMGTGASVPEVWAAVSDAVAITPKSLAESAEFTALTDAATIAWNAATQGFNVYVVMAANRTLGAPTGLLDGLTYSFYPVQDATGSRTLIWNAIFDWGELGPPLLSTGANKVDQCWGQYSALTGKIHMNFRKSA